MSLPVRHIIIRIDNHHEWRPAQTINSDKNFPSRSSWRNVTKHYKFNNPNSLLFFSIIIRFLSHLLTTHTCTHSSFYSTRVQLFSHPTSGSDFIFLNTHHTVTTKSSKSLIVLLGHNSEKTENIPNNLASTKPMPGIQKSFFLDWLFKITCLKITRLYSDLKSYTQHSSIMFKTQLHTFVWVSLIYTFKIARNSQISISAS